MRQSRWRSAKIYSSDISDLEWEWIEPILPKSKLIGRRHKVSLRAILNAIFYRADNSVKWRNLPADFPDWQTIYGYSGCGCRLVCGRELIQSGVGELRWLSGRAKEPSLGIIDSQSVKLGQKGGSGELQWMCLV